MTRDEAALMISFAERYLYSAELNVAHGPDQRPMAYEDARHAAELAGKSMLLRQVGKYPKDHHIGGALAKAALIPTAVDRRALSAFLEGHQKGRYGFYVEITEPDMDEALDLARLMVEAALAFPQGTFHPPPEDAFR